jgi:hypothetical protein
MDVAAQWPLLRILAVDDTRDPKELTTEIKNSLQ